MSGVNKVILVGNLGKDPEIRHTGNATVANFTLATSETYKDRTTGEKKTVTEWHNVVLWRGLAEIAEKYLHKGSQVYVEGKLRTRNWQDKEGNTRYTTEIVGDSMTLLGKPGDGNSSTQERQRSNREAAGEAGTTPQPAGAGQSSEDDDLPF